MTVDEFVSMYQSDDSVQPVSALVGLDDVDWSAVEDAYGPATEVPALIRALVSNNAEHREFAAELLCQTIWHQGNIFSATAATIPFLYKLLETDGPHDRRHVEGLLALIADGQPPFLHCETDPEAAAKWRPILAHSGKSLDAKIAEGHVIAENVRRELNRRPDLLAMCLEEVPDDQADEHP